MSILGLTLVNTGWKAISEYIVRTSRDALTSIVGAPFRWLGQARDSALQTVLSDRSWKKKPSGVSAGIKYAAVRALSLGRSGLYSYQEALPKLPVPEQEEALNKWLLSLHPLLSEEEFKEVKEQVTLFLEGPGPKLHDRLLEKAAQTECWIEDTWLDKAYLSNRGALNLTSNYYGLGTTERPDQYNEPVERMARMLFLNVQYLHQVRSESLEPLVYRGVPFCMHPLRSLLGATRLPGEQIDRVHTAPQSKHVLVIANNHFYKLPVFDKNGAPLRETELRTQLKRIQGEVAELPSGVAVGVLTAQDRTQWAKDREVLRQENGTVLEAIEDALFVFCLEEGSPGGDDEKVARLTFTGTENRWFDKMLQHVAFEDGTLAAEVEHTPCDATITAAMQYRINAAEKYTETPPAARQNAPTAEKLEWKLNESLRKQIEKARNSSEKAAADIDLKLLHFDAFGKKGIAAQGLSPDSFIQMAVQWTYYKLHQRLDFTYETASTRMYRKARTDTIRTVSDTTKNLVELLGTDAQRDEKVALLREAVAEHKARGFAASLGEGFDRYLLGLSQLPGAEDIALFKLPAFKLPMTVATSQTPVPNAKGGCFLPQTQDGYGISYHVRGSEITFHCTAFKSAERTDVTKFLKELESSLNDLMALLD